MGAVGGAEGVGGVYMGSARSISMVLNSENPTKDLEGGGFESGKKVCNTGWQSIM